MNTHWKKLTNPNYIGSYTVEPGKELIVEIKNVSVQKVQTGDGQTEEKVVADLVGQKPMVLNKTNMELITEVLGTPYIENWVGKKITLYVERVSAFGEMVDALRVKRQSKKIEGSKAELTEPSKAYSNTVSEPQLKLIHVLIKQKGADKEEIKRKFGITNSIPMTKTQASQVIDYLSMIEAQVAEQTNNDSVSSST